MIVQPLTLQTKISNSPCIQYELEGTTLEGKPKLANKGNLVAYMGAWQGFRKVGQRDKKLDHIWENCGNEKNGLPQLT